MSANPLFKYFDFLNSLEENEVSPGFRKLWIDILAGDNPKERDQSKREAQRTLILKAIKKHCSRKRSIDVIAEFFLIPYSTIDKLWRKIEGEMKCKIAQKK